MFRVSQYMRDINQPSPQAPRRAPRGPVVIWNLVRRCNLTCKHCYSFSADTDYAGELSTDEVFSVMDDLEAFGVPALILSGGEPLLRPDLFEIARRARQHRFYVGLSTNGTLLDQALVDQVAKSGFDYVGISIDGQRETHDRFRRLQGAFDRSVAAIRLCHSAGIKVGLRFTMTEDNAADLPWMLDFIETEQIDKFYFSHLNYAGRGNIHRGRDAFFETTRHAMDVLFDTCWRWQQQGTPREVVTGNNDADAVYFLHWVSARFPEAHIRIRRALVQWGGNASGVHIANIDNIGNVHPDTMWWDYTLGNVRERPFSDIWRDTSDPLMSGLKQKPRPLKGRCAACAHLDICGGNTRVRARQITGDPWEEDPACYLTNPEIGIPERPRRAAHRIHVLREIAT